jgi:hypothetical protein
MPLKGSQAVLFVAKEVCAAGLTRLKANRYEMQLRPNVVQGDNRRARGFHRNHPFTTHALC